MKKLFALAFFGTVLSMPAYAVDIQEVTASKSGVKAWLVEDHNLPIVALRLSFRGGSEQDPVNKQGLADLTVNALTEGAGAYSANDFQHELADHSITLSFDAGRDQIEGGLKCLSADKQEAFDLLRLALTKPRFDAKDIERLRASQLAELRQQIGDPNWQARYALFSQIYAGHPYGERHLGSTQTLNAITRDDVKNFATRHFAKDNLVVAVAGDITPAELSSALDKMTADLPAHAHLAPVAEVKEWEDLPPTLVKREGTQSELFFAMPGPKRDSDDWYAAEIANYILGGGGFSSRLMQDVRDKKGLTYGVQTGLSPAEHSGIIIGQAAVDNPKVSQALATIRETMHHFYDDGVTEHEVAAAKDYLTGSQPLELTSTDKIAGMLVEMQRDKLGRDYLDRYGEIIRGVTMQDVQDAIERWFNPSKMVIVMVGKPDIAASKDIQVKEMVRQ